jgi:iron(III) transport system substrate-binding protein
MTDPRPWLTRLDRRRFLQLTAAGLAAPAALVEACGGAPSSASSPTPGARASGPLSVYTALNESTNNAFVAAFNKVHPDVKVQLLPLAAAGDLQTRIQAEKASPRADVFIGGSSEFHDPLGKQGLLEAYKSPNARDVDAAYKDPAGYWTGWYIGIFGFVSSTSRASEVPARVQGWDDLLNPGWRGKLILPDPIKTGGGYIFLATQVFRFNRDEQKAMDYMKKLNGNIAQYVGTAPQGIQLVGQGQFVGCPNWAHDILTARNQGQKVDLVIPEPTGFEVGGLSIVRGGPNPAAARAFVDWVLTREAGQLNVQLSNRLSVRKDVPPAPGAPTLTSVKLVAYDRAWATDNKARLQKAWQQATS